LELSGCLALLQEIGKPAAGHRYFTGLMDHLASQIHSLLQKCRNALWKPRSQGYEQNPDFNGVQQEGAGLYQVTVKDGKRQSTAVAFLRPIKDRPNLTIQTGALVTRTL